MTKKINNQFHFFNFDGFINIDSIAQLSSEKDITCIRVELDAHLLAAGKYGKECSKCKGTGSESDGEVCSLCYGDGYSCHPNWYKKYLKDFERKMFSKLSQQVKKAIPFHDFSHERSIDTTAIFHLEISDIDHLSEIIRCFRATCSDFSDYDVWKAGVRVNLW